MCVGGGGHINSEYYITIMYTIRGRRLRKFFNTKISRFTVLYVHVHNEFGNHVFTHKYSTVYAVMSGGYKICQWVVYDSCLSVLGY